MKKPAVKVLSAVLCVLLLAGGTGSAVYAASTPAGSSAPVDAPPVDSGAESATPKTAPSRAPGAERNVKDETVYVLANADGTVQKIIVSNWIQNALGEDSIHDVTGLSGIENVKGNETFTLGGGSCVWDARGNDIYYQGEPDRELPVSVSVSYTLDGRPITPDELAGKSGRVTIRFDYANNQYEMVDIGGRQEKIYVPFAMLTGVVLDNGVFTNVSVSNGKIMNDGDRTIVAGLAFPGLQESLALDRDALELPEYVEITADAEGFALETTVTLAANDLFNDAANEAQGRDGLNGLSGLDGRLDELTDAMEQLMDGSSQLYDGLCALLTSSEELIKGIDQLAAGAAQLKQGASSLDAGAGQLQSGADALCQGLNALSANSAGLNSGARQVFDTLLAAANAQLAAAGLDVPAMTAENYARVLNAAIASLDETAVYQQALDQVTAAVEEQRPYIEGQVTAAVEQAVTAQVTAAVEAQVTEQAAAAAREQATAQAVQAAAQMDLDSYRAAVDAGLVDEAVQAAIAAAVDGQMDSETVRQAIAANVERQMASEPVQAAIQQNVSAQMAGEAVKAQIAASTQVQVEKAIAENMAGEAVQSRLQAASEGARSVIALKASLDSYNAFYLGLNAYTAGVDQAAEGAGELNSGINALKTGTASLSAGADQLYDGVLTLKNGAPALLDGVTQLRDGAMELSRGLREFNEQGVQKLVDAFDGDLAGLADRMDAVLSVSERYNSFSGISSDMDGQVKFIWRTEAVNPKD